MNRSMVAICAFSMLVMGCSSADYHYDYDLEAPFDSYMTYAWIPMQREVTAGMSARQAQQKNTLLDKRIKTAVSQQLVSKGLRPDEENPDLLLAYHTGIEDKVDVTDWGYSYRPGYWGSYYGGVSRDVTVTQYEEGTIIVDLIDARNKQLVWRGSVTGTLDDNPTPEQIEATLAKIMTEMFKNYPPQKR